MANGKICYIEMPATDIARAADFYKSVFGWNIRKRGDGSTSFDDGVNGLTRIAKDATIRVELELPPYVTLKDDPARRTICAWLRCPRKRRRATSCSPISLCGSRSRARDR